MNEDARKAILTEQQTPTLIDPADIRPGDTFRLVHEATCTRINDSGLIETTDGTLFGRAESSAERRGDRR